MFSRPLRPLDLLNPMKTKERMTEVDRIIDLSKQLYIGGFTDMIKVYKQLVVISQMCRDPIHLKKAMDAFKELGGHTRSYKTLETLLEKWSLEFKSKKYPSMEEIDDFNIK